jgi:hypothetical protein
MGGEKKDILVDLNKDHDLKLELYRITNDELREKYEGTERKVEVIEQLIHEKSGCKLRGLIEINKVPGIITISGNDDLSSELREYLLMIGGERNFKVNLSHKINRFQFGEDSSDLYEMKNRWGAVSKDGASTWSPLEGFQQSQPFINSNFEYSFYAAYYMDVTPISLVTVDELKFNSF